MRDAVVAASLNFFPVEIRFFHDEKMRKFICYTYKNNTMLKRRGGYMERFYRKLAKIMFNLILAVAVISVNVTCMGRYYQEELDEQLDGLRKYKDE